MFEDNMFTAFSCSFLTILALIVWTSYANHELDSHHIICVQCGDISSNDNLTQCYGNATLRNNTMTVSCDGNCMVMFIQPYNNIRMYNSNGSTTDTTTTSTPGPIPTDRFIMARRDCQTALDISVPQIGCYGPISNVARFRFVVYCECNSTLCNDFTFENESGTLPEIISPSLPPAPNETNLEPIPIRINAGWYLHQNSKRVWLTLCSTTLAAASHAFFSIPQMLKL